MSRGNDAALREARSILFAELEAASAMLAALKASQETLRPIAINGRKYGAIYSHAMQTLHKIAAAIAQAEAAGLGE